MFLTGRRRASSVPDAFNILFFETATRVPPDAGLALHLNPELLSSCVIVCLWHWHLRRVVVNEASPDKTASIAARAFPLRHAEHEMGISWKLFEVNHLFIGTGRCHTERGSVVTFLGATIPLSTSSDCCPQLFVKKSWALS